MSMNHLAKFVLAAMAVAATVSVGAATDLAKQRSELMKDVRKATKPVGEMLKGEADFDAAVLQASLAVYADASSKLNDLVPPGSEGGEAAPAIWEDPEGFAAALQDWQNAIATAVDADPQDLKSARPVVGPVLKSCKGCHDNYRIEDD